MEKRASQTAKDMYLLLLEKGIEIDKTSQGRFEKDFEHEKTLESYAHKPGRGQKAEPVIYSLPGSNRREKISALQQLNGYTFLSIGQFFRALSSEVEQTSEDKIVIGYPVVTLHGTVQGHHVYKVKDAHQSLSFLTEEETDQLIQTSPAEQVFAFILKCPA